MKRTFFALIAAVVMLPLFTSCNKNDDKNNPNPPSQKEIVKIVVTGEAEYDCKSGATKVDLAPTVELKNNNGIVHTFAANEDDYKFSVEYQASDTGDTFVLSFTADDSKVDTTKSYDIEMEFENVVVTKYYNDGTTSASTPDGMKKPTNIKGANLIGKTLKAHKVVTF